MTKSDSIDISSTIGIARRTTARRIDMEVKSWRVPRIASRRVLQKREVAAGSGEMRSGDKKNSFAKKRHARLIIRLPLSTRSPKQSTINLNKAQYGPLAAGRMRSIHF